MSIIPGIPVNDFRSMVCTPAGIAPLAATLRILSSSTITTAFAITRWPSQSLPNLMALVAAAALKQTASDNVHQNLALRNIEPPAQLMGLSGFKYPARNLYTSRRDSL